MQSILVYIAAALAEIAGCFAFWAWLRMDKSMLWLIPGAGSPLLFAWLLTLVDAAAAGRQVQAGRAVKNQLVVDDNAPLIGSKKPGYRVDAGCFSRSRLSYNSHTITLKY